MKMGLGRFEYYLIQLDILLKNASQHENPALFLYENDARTKAFMLEGLSKLYSGMHNKKRFSKLQDRFKLLEDLLGAIDYYDSYAKEFANDKTITKAITQNITEKKVEKIAELNDVLLRKKWINHHPSRTDKIRKKLRSLDWQTPEKELQLLKKFYINAIAEINSFYKETEGEFTALEDQVHELRRKLRWLSIYPQALQGAVQLVNTGNADKTVKKYLTKEIVNSSYNKLPAQGKNVDALYFEQNHFLALSYVISALGNLKDKGLKIYAIAEAIKDSGKTTDEVSIKKALAITKQKENTVESILNDAKILCTQFFEENNLEKMIGI
jgi:hypothetical protein